MVLSPGSNFQYSGWTTEANHLGNVAYRTGKKLEWDYQALRATNAVCRAVHQASGVSEGLGRHPQSITPMHRRSFLRITATAAAAGAFIPGVHAAPKRKLRKAIMYSTIGVKGSVLEKFRVMKEAGFEGVEPMGGMNRDEVIAAFKETGLEAASVCCHTHWEKPLSAPDEARARSASTDWCTSLHDAKAYGAGSVLLVPGVARNGVTYQECFDRSIVEIKKAIPVAKETGVKISIENVGNNFI